MVKNTPPPTPNLELLMEDLDALGKSLPKIPPPKKKDDLGTSGKRPNLELLMEDLGTFGKSLSRIPPRPHKKNSVLFIENFG